MDIPIREPSKRSYKKHYINNEQFLSAIMEWKERLKDDPNARISEYMGQCFITLTERLGRKTHMHTALEDMKGAALLTCCLYAKNFNPERSNNPFSYFTQIISMAFAQVHNKEKATIDGKFRYIKEKFDVCEGYDYNHYMNDCEEYQDIKDEMREEIKLGMKIGLGRKNVDLDDEL